MGAVSPGPWGNTEGCRNPWVMKSSEDGDADLSPCNFATTHLLAERSSFISPYLRDHPFDSLHSELLSSRSFATHEMEDPFAKPQGPGFRNSTGYANCFGNCSRTLSKSRNSFCRPALSGGMDWWRIEWPFSRVRFLPKFELQILKLQGPKKMQVHTPSHSIPQLHSRLFEFPQRKLANTRREQHGAPRQL